MNITYEDRKLMNKDLATAIAYANCNKRDEAERAAFALIRLLTATGIVRTPVIDFGDLG
jgi:hypothetical protein